MFLINRNLDLVDRDMGILNSHIQSVEVQVQNVESQLNDHVYVADSCSLYWRANMDSVTVFPPVKYNLWE